jgi:hypothetical protein
MKVVAGRPAVGQVVPVGAEAPPPAQAPLSKKR